MPVKIYDIDALGYLFSAENPIRDENTFVE